MKNLLVLAAGVTIATVLIHFWVKEEIKRAGLVSGGNMIVPPKGG
jgi:hypothetical protein